MAAGGGGGDESHLRAALMEAFGESSYSESDAPAGGGGAGGKRWRWEAVAGVRGGCGSAPNSSLPTSRRASSPRSREAMRFGDLPSWAVELSTLIREAICVGNVSVGPDAELTNEDEDSCPLPSDLLWREPLFDQMIANRYKPGYLCSC